MCHLVHCKDTQMRPYLEQIQYMIEAGGWSPCVTCATGTKKKKRVVTDTFCRIF